MCSKMMWIGVLALLAGASRGQDELGGDPPQVLASYTFENDAADVSGVSPPMDLSNAPLTNGTLFLNGLYGPTEPGGYLALAPVPRLSYNSFTFRLEFKPASL